MLYLVRGMILSSITLTTQTKLEHQTISNWCLYNTPAGARIITHRKYSGG